MTAPPTSHRPTSHPSADNPPAPGHAPRLLAFAALALLDTVTLIHYAIPCARSGAWLGLAALLGLTGLLAGATRSYLGHRRRLLRELTALGAGLDAEGAVAPDTDTLLGRRWRRLERLHGQGTLPDLDALAAETDGTELGQPLLGRYVLSVAVLFGLVGTMAGLGDVIAAAARALAPSLAGGGGGSGALDALASLGSALGGIEVLLGSAIGGILTTAALALLDADGTQLASALRRRLDALTLHELLPRLWPPQSEPAERLLSAIASMDARMDARLAALGELVRHELAPLGQVPLAVERVGAAVTAAVGLAAQDTAWAARAAAAQAAGAMEGAAQRASAALTTTAATLERTLGATAEELARRLEGHELARWEATQRVTERLAAVAAEQRDHLVAATLEVQRRLEALMERLGAYAQELFVHGEQRLSGRIEELQTAASALQTQVAHSSALMARASEHFDAAAGQLAGPLAHLAPELVSLSEQLALLAARADDEVASPLALLLQHELARLNDLLERSHPMAPAATQERAA
jgi:hypothetical protein